MNRSLLSYVQAVGVVAAKIAAAIGAGVIGLVIVLAYVVSWAVHSIAVAVALQALAVGLAVCLLALAVGSVPLLLVHLRHRLSRVSVVTGQTPVQVAEAEQTVSGDQEVAVSGDQGPVDVQDTPGMPSFEDWVSGVRGGQLLSVGVAGQPGTGKSTWAVTDMLARSRRGHEVWLIDPDAGNPEALADRARAVGIDIPILQLATDVREIPDLLRRFHRLLTWRADGSQDAVADLWWDEFPACLLQLSKGDQADVVGMVKELAWRGRKRRLTLRLMSQNWLAENSGESSAIRSALPISVCFATPLAEAARLTGLSTKEVPPDLPSLPALTAYVLGRGKPVQQIQVSPPSHHGWPPPEPSRSHPGATPESASQPPSRGGSGVAGVVVGGMAVSPQQQARIIELVRGGNAGETAILRDVFPDVGKGDRFVAAAAAVRAVRTAYVRDLERRLAEREGGAA